MTKTKKPTAALSPWEPVEWRAYALHQNVQVVIYKRTDGKFWWGVDNGLGRPVGNGVSDSFARAEKDIKACWHKAANARPRRTT